jgi:tetratricopeptide (TPR) repeat protein
LFFAYRSLDRKVEALDVARRLHVAWPKSDEMFDELVRCLLVNRHYDEARTLCEARATDTPDDARGLRARSRIASSQGLWSEARSARRHIVELGKAEESDYNELAWFALLEGDHGPQVVDDAEHAALFSQIPDWRHLHTLAAVYADAGRVVEARQTLIKSMDAQGLEEPGPPEWLVIGRLAEQYGAREQATAAYGRVTKPDGSTTGSSYELAQKWAAGLKTSAPAEPASQRKTQKGKR